MPASGRFSPTIMSYLEEFEDVSPVMEEIGEQIVSSIIQNFREGGRFGDDNEMGGGSQRWIPSRRAINENGQTLVRTAQAGLRDSISYRIDGNIIIVGSNKVYAAIHHFGGQTGRNKATTLPARPWAVIQNDDLEEIESIITDHYAALLHR
jgi:phage virion morphogenesis protein